MEDVTLIPVIHNSIIFTFNNLSQAIEVEPVRCPYEIFSMKDANNVCVTEITHFAEGKRCTEYTQSQDLKNSCKNPIVTQWRFSKAYDIPERELPNSSVICEGRENCEITTVYQVT